MQQTQSIAEASSADVAPLERTATPSLRRNFTWTFFGNVIYGACQWGILVVLARLGNPSMVGKYGLGLAIATPVFMFTNLQLRNIQGTDTHQQYRFAEYLWLRIASAAFGVGIVTGIVIATGLSGQTATVVMLVGIARAIDTMADVYYGLWQRQERMSFIGVGLATNGIVTILGVSYVVARTGSIVAGTVANAAGSIAALIVAAVVSQLAARKWGLGQLVTRPLPATILRLFQMCWVLGAVALASSLLTAVPRYFIQMCGGEATLGRYVAATSLMPAGTALIAALSQASSPRMARYYHETPRRVTGLVLRLSLVGIAIGFAGILVALFFGRAFMLHLFGQAYVGEVHVLTIVMCAALLDYAVTPVMYALIASRDVAGQVGVHAASLLICFGASAVLVPRFGNAGAAAAIVLTEGVRMAGCAVCLVRRLRLHAEALRQ